MHPYQRAFLTAAIEAEVLSFGNFTLKSGRQSPYFFNLGQCYTGTFLATLGNSFAACIVEHFKNDDFDVIFGGMSHLCGLQ